MAPFLLLFSAFFILPLFYTIYQSLFVEKRVSAALDSDTYLAFNALNNYAKVIHDPQFLHGVVRVLGYGAIQIPLMVGLALLLALAMDSAVIRFRPYFRLAFFLPYAVPGVIAVILWGYLYQPNLSPLVKGLVALHLLSHDANPLLSPGGILYAIGNISTWQYTGYNMIILYSSLQAIPQQIYEAARIDGASELRIAFRLKLPLIIPSVILAILFSVIGTLQLFNEPQILKPISTAITTDFSPTMYGYYTAFAYQNYYYAGAIAVVLAVVTFGLSYFFIRLSQRQA